jgi:hypothetical protein
MYGSPAANLYRALPDDMLERAVGKLNRLVRSLERDEGGRLVDSYRDALRLARRELESRRIASDAIGQLHRKGTE